MADVLAIKLALVEQLMLSDGSTLETAIRKKPALQAVVHKLGAEGNDIGYKKHHGGVDKALFFMAQSSLETLNKILELDYDYHQTTMFGENFVVSELDETQVCVGDQFRIGETLVEVSQPRKPCNRLSQNTDVPDTRRVVVETGLVGWYGRVLETGVIRQGDRLELLHRPFPELTIAQLHHCLSAPAKTLDKAYLSVAISCDKLADAYKGTLEKQLAKLEAQSDESAFFTTREF